MKNNSLKGVNLGGWLVLEKWLTPSLFEGKAAKDEFSLCQELGTAKYEVLARHRDTFITADDFAWIANSGLNAVRIPVGYSLFEDDEPFVGALRWLDWAMEQATTHKLKVLIDLHLLPGLPNDWNMSQTGGDMAWTDPSHVVRSLRVVERLSQRYSSYDCLWGIGLLNETVSGDAALRLATKEYYTAAYAAVRKYCDQRVKVIYFDDWHPEKSSKLFANMNAKGLVMDSHLYQVFSSEDKRLSVEGHINKASSEWPDLFRKVQKNVPLIVGEWSGRLNAETLDGLSPEDQLVAEHRYFIAQQQAFRDALATFYWTYKKEAPDAWSYRHMIERMAANR